MKRKILLYMFLLLSFLSLWVMYKIKNVNAFALYAIPLPQEEKFDIKIIKIEKYKVWEMKNVYRYDGDYSFQDKIDGKKPIRRFYMVNKNVDDIDGFSLKFMAQIESDFLTAKEDIINYYFYRESKKLPKYWTPVWDRHCIDELTDHSEDSLFTITTDINRNILNIDKQKYINNFSLTWKKDGTRITEALAGHEVTLYAETHNIADGTAATIKIVERDADGKDDDVATLTATVRNNTIECTWKVVYTADDDDTDSKKEQKEKGYTLPEYAFIIECDGEKSAESERLDIMGWIRTQFKDKRTRELLKNKRYRLYSPDGKTIVDSTTNDEGGFVDLKELKYGEYFIDFEA